MQTRPASPVAHLKPAGTFIAKEGPATPRACGMLGQLCPPQRRLDEAEKRYEKALKIEVVPEVGD